jgi:hypothetical protein
LSSTVRSGSLDLLAAPPECRYHFGQSCVYARHAVHRNVRCILFKFQTYRLVGLHASSKQDSASIEQERQPWPHVTRRRSFPLTAGRHRYELVTTFRLRANYRISSSLSRRSVPIQRRDSLFFFSSPLIPGRGLRSGQRGICRQAEGAWICYRCSGPLHKVSSQTSAQADHVSQGLKSECSLHE